jgi:hypothetical protein
MRWIISTHVDLCNKIFSYSIENLSSCPEEILRLFQIKNNDYICA